MVRQKKIFQDIFSRGYRAEIFEKGRIEFKGKIRFRASSENDFLLLFLLLFLPFFLFPISLFKSVMQIDVKRSFAYKVFRVEKRGERSGKIVL